MLTMEEVHIDTTEVVYQFERARTKLLSDASISQKNKEIMERYLRDAALGKTILGRAKKKIGPARLHGYIHQLLHLITFLQKDLDQVSQEDMERFIAALEEGKIIRRSVWSFGSTQREKPTPLSPRYAVDVKVTIKKFYKWLFGNNKVYPPLVDWIDTYARYKEVQALTEKEVEKMLDCAKGLVEKTMIQVLFDGGFRRDEVLNIRLRHLRRMTFVASGEQQTCFAARVVFSKTMPRTVVLPLEATTRILGLWLQEHPGRPTLQSDGSMTAADASLPLFPIRPETLNAVVARIGRRSLGKRVHPHLMRHTSATFWCNKLPYFKFCKRFGWSMTSKMPQRYIDREGVDELEVAKIYVEGSHKPEVDRQRQEMATSLLEGV